MHTKVAWPFDVAFLLACRSRAFSSNLIAANKGDSPGVAGGGLYSSGRPVNALYNTSALGINRLLIADLPASPPWHGQEGAIGFRGYDDMTVSTAAGSAGATTHGTCQLSAYQQGRCETFSVGSIPEGNQTIHVQAGPITCAVTVAFAGANNANATFAVFALDENKRFPGTPDAMRLQACGIVLCDTAATASGHKGSGGGQRVRDDVIQCAPRVTATASFLWLQLTMAGFNRTGSPVPLLAVDQVRLRLRFLSQPCCQPRAYDSRPLGPSPQAQLANASSMDFVASATGAMLRLTTPLPILSALLYSFPV